MSQLEEMAPAVRSPMPDYSIEGMGKGGEVLAIAVGTLAVLAISFGLEKCSIEKPEQKIVFSFEKPFFFQIMGDGPAWGDGLQYLFHKFGI